VANPADARSLSRRRWRAAQTTFAACLLGVALLSLLGFVLHIAKIEAPSNTLQHKSDGLESILGLVWFTSALLATIMSTSLRSPARQLILCSGGMLTVLSVFFWLSIVASL
jgi:hypothetical protein